MKTVRIIRTIIITACVLYLAWAVVFDFSMSPAEGAPANFIPFYRADGVEVHTHIRGMLIALLTFLPVGFTVIFLNKRRLLINTFIIAGIALFIEASQYIFGYGRCDITEFILYTAGGLAGYGLTYFVSHTPFKKLAIVGIILLLAAAGIVLTLILSN